MKSKLTFIMCCGALLFAACKKEMGNVPQSQDQQAKLTIMGATAAFYTVGTGSGDLLIDGSALDLSVIKKIKISAGSYSSISIQNIAGSVAQPVVITNAGQVNVAQYMNLSNVSDIVIAGNGVSTTTYGIAFQDIPYRALSIQGKINGITLKNIKFKNVVDYAISGNQNNVAYDGTANTRSENFKILNCLFDNAGSIDFGGALNSDDNVDNGFIKKLEIANCTFRNTSWGVLVSFGNVEDYNIHHNKVNNVNQTNNNHNGIFLMQGNGKFHDNKLTNYQGNSIRAWLYSRGNTPATVEIYNNVCYNTRKYSGFELQGFTRNIYPGKSTFANAKVYNNTVGKMNTSHDWEGQVLDLYSLNGGSIEYYNNLGFDLYKTQGNITDMINNQAGTPVAVSTNNLYFATQVQAVANVTHFTSLYAGVGATGF